MENRPVPIVLAAIPVLFLALGANSIWDANEAFYVETPRQMVLSGDYVSPTFNAEPRFNKPVLSYWIVAGFYHVLGESVTAERVAIAIGALGILWAAFLAGRAMRSVETGALAALMLVTAPRFVFFSRRIMIDVYVTMFMALALACFVLAERHPERRRRYLMLTYACIGLGVLTKGPVALVLPAVACLAWLLTERRLGDVRRLMLVPGALVIVAIVAPWYVAVYAEHGSKHLYEFFFVEHFGRYSTAVTTERASLFFLPVLFADILMPWAPLLVVPLTTAWRRTTGESDVAGPIRRLLWWWVVAIVTVFAFSASKEDLYILPAMPAAAVLLADLLVRTRYGATHRGVRVILLVISVLCIGMASVVFGLFRDGYYALDGAPALAGLLAIGGSLGLVSVMLHRREAAVMSLAVAFALFNYVLVLRVLPDVERMKPIPPVASIIKDRASASARLGFFNMDLPSLVYYADRPAAKLGDAETAARFLAENAEAWVLAGDGGWNELRSRVQGICVADRRPLFVAKASDVLRHRAPPDVVLITNKCK